MRLVGLEPTPPSGTASLVLRVFQFRHNRINVADGCHPLYAVSSARRLHAGQHVEFYLTLPTSPAPLTLGLGHSRVDSLPYPLFDIQQRRLIYCLYSSRKLGRGFPQFSMSLHTKRLLCTEPSAFLRLHLDLFHVVRGAILSPQNIPVD